MKSIVAGIFTVLLGLGAVSGARAQGMEALPDDALDQITGADGIGFAAHIVLNDPGISNPVTDSRLSMGFNVDGSKTFIVIKNLRGTIDISDAGLQVLKKPDGSSYVALSLPSEVRYTNYGFDSMSVQSDPLAPVSDSIGRLTINGSFTMQGQFRFWAH
jgi:hypothetical protein